VGATTSYSLSVRSLSGVAPRVLDRGWLRRVAPSSERRCLALKAPQLLDLAIGLGVIFIVSAPALFTRSGFVDDWVNHLWLSTLQEHAISATGHPSLFFNAEPMGVFYPNFAFYGGTLYGIAGYLMVLTGAPVAVFVGMIVLGFAASYFGTFWIARQAGVKGLAAHLPAIIVVTGAYYLSDAYGRGSWPEFMATSAIPVIVAAGLRVIRAGPTPVSILLLAVATTIWSGSHNISLLFGGIFLAGVAVALLSGWLTRLERIHVQRIGIALSAMFFGGLINAWFLAPDLAYGLHTQIAQFKAIDPGISGYFSRASIVFNPFRVRANHTTYLRSHFTELPVLVMAWGVIASALLWKVERKSAVRRVLGVLALLVAVLVFLLLDESAWRDLPATLSVIQFTFRLETFIVMGIAGVTIVLLRIIDKRRWHSRVLRTSLAAFVVWGLILAAWQVWNSDAYYFPTDPHYLANRSFVLGYRYTVPPTWYETGQLRGVSEPVVPTDGEVKLAPQLIKGEYTSQTVRIPPGSGALASNIAASQHLVKVQGLRTLGRTTAGFLALERPPPGRRTVRLTVSRAESIPMKLGPLATIVGAVGLLVLLLTVAVRGRGVRMRGGTPNPSNNRTQ